MLHKNVIEKSGFRQLQGDELAAISGGADIIVTDTRPDGGGIFGGGGGAGLQGGGNETGNSPDPSFGDGGGGGGNPLDISLFDDADAVDFEDFLVEETDLTREEVENQIIVTASIQGQDVILHFDGNGNGAIYLVTDNFFTKDDFTLFSVIANVQLGFTGSSSGSAGTGGFSIDLGGGVSLGFDLVGPAG